MGSPHPGVSYYRDRYGRPGLYLEIVPPFGDSVFAMRPRCTMRACTSTDIAGRLGSRFYCFTHAPPGATLQPLTAAEAAALTVEVSKRADTDPSELAVADGSARSAGVFPQVGDRVFYVLQNGSSAGQQRPGVIVRMAEVRTFSGEVRPHPSPGAVIVHVFTDPGIDGLEAHATEAWFDPTGRGHGSWSFRLRDHRSRTPATMPSPGPLPPLPSDLQAPKGWPFPDAPPSSTPEAFPLDVEPDSEPTEPRSE